MVESLEVTAQKIRALQVQGARNIAIAAVEALRLVAEKSQAQNRTQFFEQLKATQTLLAATRETEPLMRNGLRYVINRTKAAETDSLQDLQKLALTNADQFLKDMDTSRERTSEIGAKRIGDGSVVFTHCHSSTVTRMLAKAKAEGVDFSVICTETRPAFQGRLTAKELVGYGIETTFIVDNAARTFMSDVDLVFVGADAITSEGNVVNKIGTGGIAVIAAEARVPLYVVSELLKFDPETLGGGCTKIEQRNPSEVWSDAPPKLRVRNPAFDVTPNRYIHGLICEEGILPPQTISEVVKRIHPWIF